jgi:hypothetical protein
MLSISPRTTSLNALRRYWRTGPGAIPYTPEFQKLRREREQRLEEFARTQFSAVRATAIVEDGEPGMVIDWVAQQQKPTLS